MDKIFESNKNNLMGTLEELVQKALNKPEF